MARRIRRHLYTTTRLRRRIVVRRLRIVFFFANFTVTSGHRPNRFHQILTRFTCTSSLSGNTAVFKTRLTPSVSRSSAHLEAFSRLTYATTASIGAYDHDRNDDENDRANCRTKTRSITEEERRLCCEQSPPPPPSQTTILIKATTAENKHKRRRRTLLCVCVRFKELLESFDVTRCWDDDDDDVLKTVIHFESRLRVIKVVLQSVV